MKISATRKAAIAAKIIQRTSLTPEQRAAGAIVITHNYQAQGTVLFPKGRGAYPYECIAKDKYPQAMVYHNPQERTWTILHDYTEIAPAFYAHNSLFHD